MNILTDRHHNSLYNSLRILFEERLGGNLFAQVGLQWFANGFWNIYNHPATAQQYLSLDQRYQPVDGTRQLNQIAKEAKEYYELFDPEYSINQKALTFDQFLATDIDIIIASIPQHIEPFIKLRDTYKPNAKLIYQVGNTWDIQNMAIPNIMASAKVYIPPKYHSVLYGQEFDTNVFCYKKPVSQKTIYSFINCFGIQDHFKNDWQAFQNLEKNMSDWNFKSFGGQCRDGGINGSLSLAEKMSEARFGFHVKRGGDGWGHVIWNLAYIGRPLIVKQEYYLGKMAGDFLIDGETCIAIDGLPENEIIKKIQYYNEDERYNKMSNNIAKLAREKCNFDKQESSLKEFIKNLI